MRIGQRHRRNCKGISTLEFIVVLPFLLFVMLVSVELSRLLWTYNVVVQATREGARVGVVTPLDGSGNFVNGPALTRIGEVLGGANVLAGGGTVVTCTPLPPATTCGPDARITATVVVNFDTLFPGFIPLLSGLTLSEQAVMRYE